MIEPGLLARVKGGGVLVALPPNHRGDNDADTPSPRPVAQTGRAASTASARIVLAIAYERKEAFRAAMAVNAGHCLLVAFGCTKRPGAQADQDKVLTHLVGASREAVYIIAELLELHVTDALPTSLDQAVAMVAGSVAYLRSHELRLSSDVEHLFDGFRRNPPTSACE
jgi:isopropylmalate/homocitrate/citramalate synthase